MSSYFRNFPKVDYRFGDENTTTQFQHLGTYVDIIDQVKDYSVYYQTFDIRNGERPEQLSYYLYGNNDHYWTFYLLNDHLRTNGWPIRDADLFPKAQQYYPNYVSMTFGVIQKQGAKVIDDGNSVSVQWLPLDEQLPLCMSETFKIGNYVYFPSSKTAGKILNIDQKLGAITHDAEGVRDASVDRMVESIPEEEYLRVKSDPEYIPAIRYETLELYKNYDEFDAPHHYEDFDGNWIYPELSSTYPNSFIVNGYVDPANEMNPVASLTPVDNINSINSVSNFQRLIEANDRQKVISVINRDNIAQIVSEFNRLLKIG